MGLLRKLVALIFWVLTEIKTLYHILVSPVKGSTHKERLESFYKIQADNYDNYRKRLLHGRELLFSKLSEIISSKNLSNLIWVDMGAGTGYNCECMDVGLSNQVSKKDNQKSNSRSNLTKRFKEVYLVDLSTSLLVQASNRISRNSWTSVVRPIEADATLFTIPDSTSSNNNDDDDDDERLADLVTFSYSLTMIPDWFTAVEHALELLKPGGYLAIVDFYVGRKYPKGGDVQHGWFTRTFWRTFFAMDNVRLSDDHIAYLESRFVSVVYKSESSGSVPYIPFIKAPYYILILQKN